ncbi:DUF2690 domain-containing protein [Bacillus cereus]
MFKKLMKVCVLSAASIGVLFSFQGSTFAATDLSSYYDGKNPATTKVYGEVQHVMQMDLMQSLQQFMKVVKKVGTVYLRYSNKCHAAWAKFVLDQPAPAVSGGVYAYAVVNKYKNDVFQKSVTSNQGNGYNKNRSNEHLYRNGI